MYHIKTDKRCKRSVDLIYKSVKTLLDEKPLDKISVTDIQKVSGVGRSTFYRNFDTVLDVIVMKSDEYGAAMAKTISEKILNNGNKLDSSLIISFFDYWRENDEIILLLKKINRLDILFYSLMDAYASIGNILFPGIDRESTEYQYFIATKIAVGIGMTSRWITKDSDKTSEDMLNIIRNGFNNASKFIFG